MKLNLLVAVLCSMALSGCSTRPIDIPIPSDRQTEMGDAREHEAQRMEELNRSRQQEKKNMEEEQRLLWDEMSK